MEEREFPDGGSLHEVPDLVERGMSPADARAVFAGCVYRVRDEKIGAPDEITDSSGKTNPIGVRAVRAGS